jgi:hypothetical protein
MSLNGIAHLSTKEARLEAKLEFAQGKRSGYIVAYDGTISGSPDITLRYFKELNTFDVDYLPMSYTGNTLVDNPNIGGLKPGRPWLPFPPITYALLLESNTDLALEDGTIFYLE